MAAVDKTDHFPFKPPPRADSFMRWLGSTFGGTTAGKAVTELSPSTEQYDEG